MSARNFVGDATAALVALLAIDPATLPVDLGALRTHLQRAVRCRRWSRAIEHAWELARHELDVASGVRRAGMVA